jgi:hypothetical protein
MGAKVNPGNAKLQNTKFKMIAAVPLYILDFSF